MTRRQRYTDVVIAVAGDRISLRRLHQHRANGASTCFGEHCALLLGEDPEHPGAAAAILDRHYSSHSRCRRVLPFGVGEDMEIGNRQSIQEIVCLQKMLLRLSRETDDHINTDGGMGDHLENLLHTIPIEGTTVATAHHCENVIGAALQRHMEMWKQVAGSGGKRDDPFFEKVRLDRGDLQPPETLDSVHCNKQIKKRGILLSAEVADVYTRQHYLSVAPLYQFRCLAAGRLDRLAAAEATGQRYGAEGA